MSYSRHCACADDRPAFKPDTQRFACSARVTHTSHLCTRFFSSKPQGSLPLSLHFLIERSFFRRRIECTIAELHAAACTTRVQYSTPQRVPPYLGTSAWVICVKFRVSSFAYSDRAHRALSNGATNSHLAHTNMSRKFAIFAFAGCAHPPLSQRFSHEPIIGTRHRMRSRR